MEEEGVFAYPMIMLASLIKGEPHTDEAARARTSARAEVEIILRGEGG